MSFRANILVMIWGILALLFWGPASGRGQPTADSTVQDTISVLDRLAPMLDPFGTNDQATDRAAERLVALRRQPLDLNRVSAADLSELPYLSTALAHRIVRYRSTHGPFKHLRTLQEVDGLTTETMRQIRPFLTIQRPSSSALFPSVETVASNLDAILTQRYTRDLDLGRGFKTDEFLGPPGRMTSRFRLDYGRRLQFALTFDKDPGEPIRWAPNNQTYGFDHVVGSLTLRDFGVLETVILGNFSAQFGQGVALWQGIRFGKGRDPIGPVLQSGRGILPYRSSSESNYFRGVATAVSLLGDLTLTTFLSRRARDASLDSSGVTPRMTSGSLPVRTLSTGGQHRTPTEIARKGTFKESTLGGALEFHSSTLHLGVTGYYAGFNRPLRPGNEPYRRYRVSGHQTSAVSAYGSAYLDNYTLFGEVARSPNGAYGGVVGGSLDFRDRAKAILLGRRYPAHLAPFYGSAFGNGGRPQNEVGVYTGLSVKVTESWTIGGYVDQFRAPWLQFNVPRPTTGLEARIVLKHNPRPWLSSYLQLRAERQEAGTEYKGLTGQLLEGVQREIRQSVRWHTEYVFSDALALRTRLEGSHFSAPDRTAGGFFLSQGIQWTPFNTLQLDARVAFFDTDGFAARIYAYERDLLYSFSVPVFFDEGRRSYVLVEYEPFPGLSIEAKYGVTSYAHRRSIGSGLNQVQGSSRRELRLQVRWSL